MKRPKRHIFLVLCLAVLVAGPAFAQYTPVSGGGAARLDELLQRLGEHRRVLMVGAHPDDEDTGLLALFARGYGAEAAYLSLSRGEGGQNLIGAELGIGLGLVRTRELEAARRVDGAGQFFTRAFDFGYSRSVDETAVAWPPDSVLKDAVRVVRRFRPHVIVAVWSGTERDGHGQHSMSGVIAQQMFDAAADATRFPELANEEGLAPWTPLKLVLSRRFEPNAATLTLETGHLDPRTGRSYHQIAMASRSQHASQDMGVPQDIGPAQARVSVVRDRTGVGTDEFFAGVPRDTSWTARLADSLRANLAPSTLERAVPVLSRALVRARSQGVAADRIALLEEATATAAGVVLDATLDREVGVAGDSVRIRARVYNAGQAAIEVRTIAVEGLMVAADQRVIRVPPLVLHETELIVVVPDTIVASDPYFLQRPMVGSLYDWSGADPTVRGLPFAPSAVRVRASITVSGAPLDLNREVVYRRVDQARGEIRRPFRIAPAVEVALEPELIVWPVAAADTARFTVTVRSNVQRAVRGAVQISANGWMVPPPASVSLEPDERRDVHFTLRRPRGVDRGSAQVRAAFVSEDGRRYDRRVEVIDYDHIAPVAWSRAAVADVRVAPIALPRLQRIGYVRGASDKVPEALERIGLPIELIGDDTLERGNLSGYDVVIVGPRAYETNPVLIASNGRLLEYVQRGGVLIVQYQQYQFARGGYAPYPMDIRRPHDRITDETAPVRVLDASHRVFTRPNQISESDWQDWPQERGLYFAGEWDERYTPLLEMQDPGMPPMRGGLLIASVGSGTYVYTGISFFRALPGGAVGAYRLFANLVALGERR